ncbi:DUF4192 domain-containing protein [Williamsia sterculiae]|nr:DUF4192 domain-containing protein [Williamsia sterculiae]
MNSDSGASADGLDQHPHTVRIHGGGDLIAAIGPLLGFLPERSIVLICLRGGQIRMSMRHDLLLDHRGTPVPALVGVLRRLAALCSDHEDSVLYAVIVDDRYPDHSTVYAEVMELIEGLLADDRALGGGYVVPEIEAGARWTQIAGAVGTDDGTGVLEDPRTTPLAIAHAVVGGRRMLRTRAELVASLEPLTPCDAVACPVHTPARRDPIDAGPSAAEDHLATVMRMLTHPAGGQMSCRRLERLAAGLTSIPARDALLAVAVTDLHDVAEALWRLGARRLRGRPQAAAATLLAHLYYISGDGAAAGVALDVALAADPHASLARLLDRSLRAGMHPSTLWDLLGDSYAIADDLGVRIPPPTRRIAG